MSTKPNTSTAETAGKTGAATPEAVKAASPRSLGDLRADAARARAELASTLDAVETKLNLPKQLRITRRRITLGLRKLGDENPAALIGVAVAAAVVAGTAVWLGVRVATRR
ncbi:MAG: hypothetical protein ABIX44_03020 [Cryobacterium sp.]